MAGERPECQPCSGRSQSGCDFLAAKGCNVRYLPAGCDTREEFSRRMCNRFEQVYPSGGHSFCPVAEKPVPRGTKDYRSRGTTESRRVHLHAVLIGPDDDGVPVDSPNATYLGRQPRNVVRGALMSCIALCNMSTSESFGIVLLEAWLAGKPVIVNKNCAAFHEWRWMGNGAVLPVMRNYRNARRAPALNPELRARLANNGIAVTGRFDRAAVSQRFLTACTDIAL